MTGARAEQVSHRRKPRVALVTGASSGIGFAVAEMLHASGWVVIGVSRRGTGGSGWQHERVDVTDRIAVSAAVAALEASHGRLDAVISCAGWGVAGPVETTPVDVARDQFDANFWGTVHVVQAALSHLRASRGRIVVISSIAGAMGIPFQAMYAASKFALEGWAESLSWEMEPFGVQVVVVQPGNVETGFTDARRTDPDAGPYRAAAHRAVARMERDERSGADPRRVAGVVMEMLDTARPPLRVSVGAFDERAGLWARRFLPFRLFRRLAHNSLTGG